MPHKIQDVGDYHAGDALTLQVSVQDDGGTAIDITGANEIEWYLKNNDTDSDAEAVLTKTLTGGDIAITDGPNGEFEVDIATGDTTAETGTYHHRARLEDSDGDRSTLFHGDFEISV